MIIVCWIVEWFSVYLEPVLLIGDGEYNLNVLKEIKVTSNLLELDKNVIGCQNEEPLFNCTTRKYIDSLMYQCGCLPYNIRLYNEMAPLCSSKQLECVHNVRVDTRRECLPTCSGLSVTSFSKSNQMKNIVDLISSKDIAAYLRISR